MGGTGSAQRVTFSSDGTVQVSEAVVQRIVEGSKVSGEMTTTREFKEPSLPTESRSMDSLQRREMHLDDLKKVDNAWADRVSELERQNRELYKVVTSTFANTLKEVEERFKKQTCTPICQENKGKVLECYQLNGKQPLNCSKEVADFVKCVDYQRSDLIFRRG